MWRDVREEGGRRALIELNSLALCIFQSYPYDLVFDAEGRPSALGARLVNVLDLRGVAVFTVAPFARLPGQALPVSSLGLVSPAGHVFIDAISVCRNAAPCDRPAGIYSVAGLGV